jgi:hypothetical protein
MEKTHDIKQEPQLIIEYSKDPMFRSTHADGIVGGLTPNGQLHIAFFSERAQLPKRHVYTFNADGSIGPQLPEERNPRETIFRDIQVDVLMTIQAAEGLKSWLDAFIKNLRTRASETRGLTALQTDIGRAGAA